MGRNVLLMDRWTDGQTHGHHCDIIRPILNVFNICEAKYLHKVLLLNNIIYISVSFPISICIRPYYFRLVTQLFTYKEINRKFQ